jgi:hypothetical protein
VQASAVRGMQRGATSSECWGEGTCAQRWCPPRSQPLSEKYRSAQLICMHAHGVLDCRNKRRPVVQRPRKLPHTMALRWIERQCSGWESGLCMACMLTRREVLGVAAWFAFRQSCKRAPGTRMCVFVVSEERVVVVVDVIPGDESVDVLLQVCCRRAGSRCVGPENHLARRTQHAPVTPCRGLAHCCPSIE